MLDGEKYRVVHVAYHKTSESYSGQVVLQTELYTIFTPVPCNGQGDNAHWYGDGSVVDEQQCWYVSSCTELANRFLRQCGIPRTYSNRNAILRGDDKEVV